MKTGRTLEAVAAEVERIHKTKRDYVADTRHLELASDEHGSILSIAGADIPALTVSPLAHSQIADRLDIPSRYYKRLASQHPSILDQNVNGLFAEKPERRMVRALDGRVRAFLSDRYQRLDNWDLANVILPELKRLGDAYEGIEVESCELTEQRLYIKARLPKVEVDLGVIQSGRYAGLRDIVQPLLCFTNSEVGKGALSASLGIWRKVCVNGLMGLDVLSRHHLGAQVGDGGDVEELYADDTIRADAEAFWRKVRDVTRAMVDEVSFGLYAEKFRATQEVGMARPAKAVEVLQDRYGFSQGEGESILTELVADGQPTLFGLINAITAMAQQVEDYDRASEVESFAGRLLHEAPLAREVVAAR